jgi:hypothetical protein
MPYSDEPDWLVRVFVSESRAKKLVARLNKEAWEDKESWQGDPDMLYSYRAIDLDLNNE